MRMWVSCVQAVWVGGEQDVHGVQHTALSHACPTAWPWFFFCEASVGASCRSILKEI